MERETVTKFDLDAAFKALDEIAFPDVSGKGRFTPNRINLKERLQAKHAHEVLVEDYFDVSMEEDLNEAQEQRDAEVAKAKLARIEKIVDLDAESEEDILPSYVGKVIMQCPQCMTLFYKNEEDIEKSEETPDVVNINEICQHCGNSSGYTLVGKVGGVDEAEMSNFEGGEEGAAEEGIEDELNLDFPEEGTEEVDAEGTGEAGAAMEDEELDLNLDFEEESEEEEPEEETNESLHTSELLSDMEKKDDLKSDIESEHVTLNEEFDEESVEEDLADIARKVFDKPASTETQQAWEDELNGEMGEISDKRRAHLEKKFAQQRDWEARHEATPADTEAPVEELVAIESLHNSELLDKIEDKNELNTEIESEHTTLIEGAEVEETTPVAEEIEADETKVEEPITEAADLRIFVDQSGSLAGRKDEIMSKVVADYPGSENQIEFFDDAECAGPLASAEAGQKVVVYTNGDCEANCPALCKIATIKNVDETVTEELDTDAALTEDAEMDELLDELWDGPQPTDAEIEADLAVMSQEAEDEEVFEEFDDNFDTRVTDYLKEVYSNVEKYESTTCSANDKKLIVEGKITFKSGKTRATQFVFESTKRIDNEIVYSGINESLAGATKAFSMTCKAEGTKLVTESFKYSYKIEESLVRGSK
jgi:hypothetical protein